MQIRTGCEFVISLVVLTLGFSNNAFAQSELLPGPATRLMGTPKISVENRTYVVYGGQTVNELTFKLSVEEYDNSGKLIRESEFGAAIERRTTYRRDNNVVKKEVHYFDAQGVQNDALDKDFKPDSNIASEQGLCPSFSEIQEIDKTAKVERYREICPDGSQRATTTLEYGAANELIRDFRQDSRSRMWEAIFEYDSSGNQTEQRFHVSDGQRPSYVQTVRYSDYRADQNGNWTRVTAVENDSLHADQIRYQFVENRTIEYWPKGAAR